MYIELPRYGKAYPAELQIILWKKEEAYENI
jgi:hypothetical protein